MLIKYRIYYCNIIYFTIVTDEDNDDVIESFSLYYIFSVFPSFVYYYSRHKNNCLNSRGMSVFARYKSQKIR